MLLYCRSSCVPYVSAPHIGNHALQHAPPPLPHSSTTCSPSPLPSPHPPRSLLTVDAIYWHQRPSASNCPQVVFDALAGVLDAVSLHPPHIHESSARQVL